MAADLIGRLKSGLSLGVAGIGQMLADPGNEIVNRQREDTRATLPVLALFHLAAILAYCEVALNSLSTKAIVIWLVLGLVLEKFLIFGYFALGRRRAEGLQAQKALRFAPLLSLAMTVYWLWASVGNSRTLPPALYDTASVIALATMFVGAMVAIRLPTTSVPFVLGLVVLGAYRSAGALGTNLFLPYLVGAACILGLSSVLMLLGYASRRRAQLERNMRRDSEVIKMLLNDVGSESGDLLWETDGEGKLREFSPRLAEVLNLKADDETCKDFEQRFFGPHAPQLLERLAAHDILRNEKVEFEYKGAATYWQVSARPMINDDGNFVGYRGVARDVTSQHEHESKLAQARDLAQQANDSKSQFLAVISHELRTPINAIVGFSEVLSAGQSEHLSVSARREYLGTILESAKHLQGLINEILEATRIERGTLQLDEQPNDAAELIEIVAKIVRDQATQARISVVARVVEDVEVTGDLTRLKQVILNILSNAIKFSPEGGVVNMDMLRAPNGDLLITVRDAGIGISDEDAERVFEPFVQVENGSNRRFGGMGLGLSIARRIAQLHGGSLTLKGEAGSGTEARFTLPATRVRWPKPKAKTQGKTAAA